ncbi:type II toxin-antitoxin system RelE/ParE family toxin [Cronobacter malonaticus]|uniref:toxin HigB-2 n=1 Tax=Cronobacter malonaticus TaxID=413503 RepID=UPI000CFD83A9|nr:toxin HigB-2 [Cronobacter malonaticus]EKY3230845.1 type II toxin-antitoxin system RelE/ParE family toxin [Cronobacter malonaticus]ELY4025682.1 type II toxin-antitoxin system RelE/ParE family toxin [Cronobacter malonaticus]MDI7684282.1 type II toxin-antitoxin system RelE/ParE family toxin [Cronobacter malonaticus]MDT3623859.1 type II toxin-antitoxin system RelE/ParE family toxin [Cronobacter malonaticus]
MLFIETEIFTRAVAALLSDDDYQRLQWFLALWPDYGDVIPDTGGLRKARWLAGGRGKRGSVRIIYFYRAAADEIRLLLIYRKGIKDDLSPHEKSVLRMLNERW